MSDTQTGLPDLPEGHFWHVQEHRIEIVKWGDWTGWQAAGFTWPRPQSITYEVDKKQSHRKRRRWLVTVTEEVTLYRTREAIPVATAKYGTYETVEVTGAPGGYVTSDFFNPVREITKRERLIDPDPVDASNLLDRANDLFAEWTARVAAQKLYGASPPKRFVPEVTP